ncbi:hypothetical protein GQ457_16G008580 [Hibiscus cannabinus]
MINTLQNNDSKIAITTDMWTSTHQKKGFMAITAHFIDDSWILQSRIIRFTYVPCPHTAEVICDVLSESLMDWNIDNKISALALDNCSTNDKMMKLICGKLTPNSLWLDGNLLHVRCSAHILNLIVKDGLEIIKSFIDNVCDSVTFWIATPKRIEKFQETACQLNIHVTTKIALDCSTRWNSTYHMLNVVLSYKEVFKRLKKRDNLFLSCPSDEEWETAQIICDKLKIFYDATEFFSRTDYPTINIFLPKICDIRVSLRQWAASSFSYVRDMTARMVHKFDKYWTDVNLILSIATIFDPRYKFKVLQYYLPLLHGEIKAKVEMERIKTACYQLVVEYSKLNISEDFENVTQSSPTPFRGDSEITSFDDFVAASEHCFENVGVEFDHYLEERLLPRKGEFNLLAWWKNCLKYPILRLIARDIFAIPTSTVASESAFSTGGRVISDSRSSLNNDTIEALMCTQSWLRIDLKDYESVNDSLLWNITKDMDTHVLQGDTPVEASSPTMVESGPLVVVSTGSQGVPSTASPISPGLQSTRSSPIELPVQTGSVLSSPIIDGDDIQSSPTQVPEYEAGLESDRNLVFKPLESNVGTEAVAYPNNHFFDEDNQDEREEVNQVFVDHC